MGAYEDWLRQKAGLPLEQASNQLGQSADTAAAAGIDAAKKKLKAMQAVAAKFGGGQGQMVPQQPPPTNTVVPQVQPNDPSMSQSDQDSRMNAMINGSDQMQNAAAKLRAQAALDQAAQDHQNSLEDQDMSGYSDVPKDKFGKLKSQLKDDDDE